MSIGRSIGSPIGAPRRAASANTGLVGTATVTAAGQAIVQSAATLAADAAMNQGEVGAAKRVSATFAGAATIFGDATSKLRSRPTLAGTATISGKANQDWPRTRTRVRHGRPSQQFPRSVTSISKFA